MNIPSKKSIYPSFNLDIPKMGDTICVKSDGKFFNLGIEIRQKQKGFSNNNAVYTHVEISGGGHRSMRITPPVSQRIDITKVYAGRYIRIRRYKGQDWERKRKHVAWVNATLCNTRYDNLGIIRFLLKWIKQHTSKWFCSEGWLYSMQTEYPNALNGMKPEDCMPAHAASSTEFKTIWEGVIPRKLAEKPDKKGERK